MKKLNRFPPGVRERAVRTVLDHRGEYPSLWAVGKPSPTWLIALKVFTIESAGTVILTK